MKVFALLTDAFGGHGGIAVFNRDFLHALLEGLSDSEIVAVPRVVARPIKGLPSRLDYRANAARGAKSFLWAVFSSLAEVRQADLIYCAHLNLAPLAWLLGRLTGRPVLGALYGIEAWTPPVQSLTAWAARRLNHYYAISSCTRERFAAWSGVPQSRIDLLPNAIHLDAYGPEPKSRDLAKRLGLEGAPVLLTFGRLVSQERAKGFDEVLDVLPNLVRSYPKLIYVIAGEGEDRSRLEARVNHEGLSAHVVFTGYVDESEKADLYRLADLYVMPSRGEGFGFVFLEAMACGVPVVASSVDGSRDAVRGGLLGPTVDPDRPSELLQAIHTGLQEQVGTVPAELRYFSYAKFVERANHIAGKAVAA